MIRTGRERAHLGEPPPPRDRGGEQVGVEGEERGAFASELFVQFGDDLPPVAGVGDEAAHLPRVEAPIERIGVDDEPAGQVADEGQREEQDGLGRAQARHPSVVGVQQHQYGYPLRVVEGPVDRRRTGRIVGDERDLIEPQMRDDGVQVAGLVRGGIRIARRLVGATPAEEIEGDDPARGVQPRHQPVVEVEVVGEAVHQDDGGFLARVVADIDPMLAARYPRFHVRHHSAPRGCVIVAYGAVTLVGARQYRRTSEAVAHATGSLALVACASQGALPDTPRSGERPRLFGTLGSSCHAARRPGRARR
jgi:hypothetical protein